MWNGHRQLFVENPWTLTIGLINVGEDVSENSDIMIASPLVSKVRIKQTVCGICSIGGLGRLSNKMVSATFLFIPLSSALFSLRHSTIEVTTSGQLDNCGL